MRIRRGEVLSMAAIALIAGCGSRSSDATGEGDGRFRVRGVERVRVK